MKEEVHRYKTQEVSCLIEDIKKDIQNSNAKCSYLISFIPKNQEYKLPNVSISSIDELETFYEKYLQTHNKKYAEMWYFKKFANKNLNNLIGRIAIDNRHVYDNASDFKSSQIVEQVWSANHREIERYNEKLGFTFLSASREGWNKRYKIDKIKIPEGINIDKDKILRQFAEIVKEIELRRENIENFSEYLKTLGVKSFSIEYMVREGRLSFIDWDSENDIKVVNNLIKNRVIER